MGFRSVPNSVPLSDLKCQWLLLSVILKNTSAVGAKCVKFTEARRVLQRE